MVHGPFRHYRPLHTVKGCGMPLDVDRLDPSVPDPTRPATWRFALPHTTAAVPLARALIRNTLADIGAPVDGDTAELLTAELVANAVRHTAGDEPIELVVELVPTGGWQVEVHDQDPNPPGELDALGRPEGPKRPDGLAEGGRGLLLIRTLSADAGYRPTPYGKAVWFVLPPMEYLTERAGESPGEQGTAERAEEHPTERGRAERAEEHPTDQDPTERPGQHPTERAPAERPTER
ncbi:hypothetical protein Shyhy02_21460 [Streptomyces hygroscopicus subsp. hygroscopicus]|nr:hypothetical protein Shyhy02_21460 [Streptomyces hygroscopicus subsp. hygroscopicus]